MVTVEDVLSIPSVSRGRPEILAGAECLDRDVRWVHVSDLSDLTRLLDGGEVVLTTGRPLTGSPQDAARYVDAASKAGAVALIVELGPDLSAVPESAVARARAAALPLIALRRRVRFIDVTQHVHRSLVSDQLERVSFAERVHSTFTELGLRRADQASIVEAAARLIGSPVVLENQRRQVIEVSGGPDDIADWERRSRAATMTATTTVVGPEDWVSTPVGVVGHIWGRLIVTNDTDTQRSTVVIERAAQALEIQRMIDRDNFAHELRLHGRTISSLIEGGFTSEGEAIARLEAVGVRRGPGYRALMISHGNHDNPDALVNRVRQELRRTDHDAIVGVLGPATVAALVITEPADDAWLGSFAAAIRQEDPRSLIGAGPWTKAVLGSREAFASARRAVEIASLLPDRGEPVVRLEDLGLHALLDSLLGDLRMTQFIDNEIGELLKHDERTGDGLLGLLRVYLRENGNVTRVARTSHRNRSSLYRRLQRLEEIVGRSLEDANNRTSLTIALMAHDLGSDSV